MPWSWDCYHLHLTNVPLLCHKIWIIITSKQSHLLHTLYVRDYSPQNKLPGLVDYCWEVPIGLFVYLVVALRRYERFDFTRHQECGINWWDIHIGGVHTGSVVSGCTLQPVQIELIPPPPPPWTNGRHFTDAICRCIFLNENFIFWLKFSLKATRHYQNQCWPDSLMHICGTRGEMS